MSFEPFRNFRWRHRPLDSFPNVPLCPMNTPSECQKHSVDRSYNLGTCFSHFTCFIDRGYLITIDLPLWSPIFIIEMWSRVTKEEFKTWCFLTTDRKCPYFLYDVIVTSEDKNQKYMFKYSHIIYHFEANLMLIQNYNRTLSRKSIFKPEIEKKAKIGVSRIS